MRPETRGIPTRPPDETAQRQLLAPADEDEGEIELWTDSYSLADAFADPEFEAHGLLRAA